MKISVIIPVYNVEQYLKRCIESILTQSFSEYEILLIDDGSTDNSGKICDEYAEKYSQIKVIHQQNKGQGGARNTGILASKGEYLLFVDSDDCLKEGALEKLYDTAKNTEADIVFFGADFVDEQGNILSVRAPKQNDTFIADDERLLTFYKDTCPWDKLYKRSLFTDNEVFFPERIWYEDLCVVAEIVLFAEKIYCITDSLYGYLQRAGSTMHIKNTDRNVDMLTAVSEILNFYKKHNRFEENRDALCFLAVMHIMVLCTLRVASEDPKHPLLKRFYDYTAENFPDFKTNRFVKSNLSSRHRLIFFLSKRRCYRALKLLNSLYQKR